MSDISLSSQSDASPAIVPTPSAVIAEPTKGGNRKPVPKVDSNRVNALCLEMPRLSTDDYHDANALVTHGAFVSDELSSLYCSDKIVADIQSVKPQHMSMSFAGIVAISERFQKGINNVEFLLTEAVLTNARNIVEALPQNGEENRQQLLTPFFVNPQAKEEISLFYSCRGNATSKLLALVPLNPEGATIVWFPHNKENSKQWHQFCEDQAPTAFRMGDAACLELAKHKSKAHSVHVAQGEMFVTDTSTCFTFEREPNMVVQAVTYEVSEKHKRRYNTWKDMLEKSKGCFDVRQKFGIEQFSGLSLPKLSLEDMAARLESKSNVATPEQVSWLTTSGVKKSKKAASAPVETSVVDVNGLIARAQALNPRIWNSEFETAVKTAQAEGNKKKYKTALDRLQKKLEEAEGASVAPMLAKFEKCEQMIKTIVIPQSEKSILKSMSKAKTMFAELIKKQCLLGQDNNVDKLHAQLVEKVVNRLTNSSKKAKKEKVSVQEKILTGSEVDQYCEDMYVFLESLSDEKKKQPNMIQLKSLFDTLFATLTNVKKDDMPNFSFNVGPMEACKNATASKTTASAAVAVKCHKKSGGCGLIVPGLYESDVCLSCFKKHLKTKMEDVWAVFKRLQKHDPDAYASSVKLQSDIRKEYAAVFPEKKSTVPNDPATLSKLVKQAIKLYSTKKQKNDDDDVIIAVEEDLEDEDEEDDDEEDEDEEDDSIVVSDDVVSFESDDSSSSDYESKKNSSNKRERKDEGPASSIANRILLARHRTPIESRLNELYDLHYRAATHSADSEKLLAAAEVKLNELEELKRAFIITTSLNSKPMQQYQFYFFTEEEAESKLALLEKQTPGLKGNVVEKHIE